MRSLPNTAAWPELGVKGRNSYRTNGELVDMRRPVSPLAAAHLKALPRDVIYERGRAALIVIDMQNDFCSAGGWIEKLGADVSGARALFEPINTATSAFRERRMPVIWLNWGVRPDRLNLSPGTQLTFNPTGCGPGLADPMTGSRGSHNVLQKESWGAAIADGLVQGDRDIHVDKHRISGFWDTPLDSILRNLNVSTLFFAGVNADHCVLATLMDANFHGYDTVLLEDCTTTSSPEFCLRATLHNVRFCFGFTTTSADLAASVLAP